MPGGAQGTALGIVALFALAFALALIFRKPPYWFLGIAAIYAAVLVVRRRRR